MSKAAPGRDLAGVPRRGPAERKNSHRAAAHSGYNTAVRHDGTRRVSVRAVTLRTLVWPLLLAAALAVSPRGQSPEPDGVGDRVGYLTRSSVWRQVAATPVGFRTFHPQGMTQVGETFLVSAVEVTTPPERFPRPMDGFDRSAGAGIAHLFKMDARGRLLAETTLGAGSIYHPGGIDFDGTDVWVPVAEYRPDSQSIVYRVNPVTMRATEVFRFDDHIGGIIHDTGERVLHGISWGSRRFYRWALDAGGRVTNVDAPPEALRTLNPSHYIDYQDCAFAGRARMVCTGLADIRQSGGPVVRLGGLELVSLSDGRPLHQVPVPLWTPAGRPMTQNPAWFEAVPGGLRAWFMPDDDQSTLYVYEVDLP